MSKFHPHNYYHVYNRGVNRHQIFYRERNWGFFITKLRQYFDPDLVDVLAYCLMPNHYHLLIYIKAEHDFGRKVMMPFVTSYTKAINAQEKRVGPLFQGRFKSIHVDDEAYLLNLTRYIHRNPVDAGLVDRPQDWPYSSYLDYVGLRDGSLPMTNVVLDRFESVSVYRDYVEEGDGVQDVEPYVLD